MSLVGSTAAIALSRLGRVLPVDPSVLSDLQLVSLVEQAEEASRQVEAVKLAAAREVARRSDAGDAGSLAGRLGYKTPAQAIEAITKSSAGEARKLVADAAALAKLPAVEAAVLDGRIGRDAVAAIAGELTKAAATFAASDAPDGAAQPAAGAPDLARLAAVEAELVDLAATSTADQVRTRAHLLAVELTPQVVQAQADRAMQQRFFWISPTRDGAARLAGLLPAGHAAVIRSTLDAYVNPKGKKTVAFTNSETGAPADSSADDGTAPAAGHPADARSAGQKRADLIRDVFAAQARAAEAPDMGGDHPTVWITTSAAELATGDGLAHYAGDSGPVPAAEATQAACTGGTQTVIFGDDGRLLNLGREVRGFTRRQRRAIAARDGGTCLIPDCAVPAQWCEVHHVVAYADGGATDAANGVNLCWFHHHQIEFGAWRIRMRDGTPEIRYTFGKNAREWAPAGDGAAAQLRARRQRLPDQPAETDAPHPAERPPG